MKLRVLFIFVLLSQGIVADSGREIWSLLVDKKNRIKNYPKVVELLTQKKLYFTSVPFIKEYLVRSNTPYSRRMDHLLDEVITHVGIRQFEVLPTSILRKYKNPSVKYILAKKLFRFGKYDQAMSFLETSIPKSHPSRPFLLLIEGSIQSIKKQYGTAISTLQNCVELSEKQMSTMKKSNRFRQLVMNRDYCLAGIARTLFAAKKYKQANSAYLDIDKRSFIWPEILFEEAWNSFYLKDYNRTLGKLVTYKAPLLEYIFNPETELLKALTYMELCLWSDVKVTVEDFYKKYQRPYNKVVRFLNKVGKNYNYHYMLSRNYVDGREKGLPLLNNLLAYTTKDPSYIEMMENYISGAGEISLLRSNFGGQLGAILAKSLKDTLVFQKKLIGAYTRKSLFTMMGQLNKTFQGISYINLEVLGRKKESLYDPKKTFNRSRGDIRNLLRTEKQYFWDFIGEFWADELGDYVFSLKSECK